MEYIIKSNSYRLLKTELDKLIKDIDKENISYFDLSVDNIKTILEEANYVSLFNDKKAIIVYNSFIFGTKYEYKNELEILEDYLNNPNNNTTLIFLTDNIKKTKKCVKLINSKGNLLELNMPEKDNLKKEIIKYLKDKSYKIENNALELLINRLDNNYDYILNELDKVLIMKKDYLININDIKEYTINIENIDIFKYVDLVIKKDIEKCLEELNIIIENNIEPAIILSNIATQYRLIYSTKNLIKQGLTEKNIADELSVHPYRIKLAHDNSYKYSNEEVKEKLLYIGELDRKIKVGELDKYNALKIFIINL